MTEVKQGYELILGLRPDLSAERSKKILEKAKELIADAGGKVEEIKGRGLTKLAYPIAGFTEANFTNIFFGIPGDKPEAHAPLAGKIGPLQKELRMIKDILRVMIVTTEARKKK